MVTAESSLCRLGLVKIYSEEKSSDDLAVGETGSTPIGVERPGRVAQITCRSGTRLEALAVEVLTALGERDGAVRDAQLRAGGALLAMTDDEGCPCGKRSNGAVAASHCGK